MFCPTMGKKRIAQTLAKARLALAVSTTATTRTAGKRMNPVLFMAALTLRTRAGHSVGAPDDPVVRCNKKIPAAIRRRGRQVVAAARRTREGLVRSNLINRSVIDREVRVVVDARIAPVEREVRPVFRYLEL